ncbi:EF-hand and coiled-coil domain-containing protein 1 isoform X2 [Cololabis saira]|uniref:EF-hand and coiled-coil domain-containing protein 1 isoform X2 n=1 Tax=Cololabis saira TaxID=129043 RepID=UPI002AD20C6F|nr:EF-hand and coiled-coil domain-containing protein 1 isoform X2 [Cololabis saira]
MERVQPAGPWLRRALAHHHSPGPDPAADNQIIVLATGIDQYLQEVFQHLAYPSQDDTVSAEDFTALCAVLGCAPAGAGGAAGDAAGDAPGTRDEEELGDICSGLPGQISFKDFHLRLCGYFRVRGAEQGSGTGTGSGTGRCAWRMPLSEDTELLETQIRVRWPRVRRRKCVSFDLTRDQRSTKTPNMERLRELDELAALRELVEDLRSALQGSDARCLALEVALRQQRSTSAAFPPRHSPPIPAPAPSGTGVQGEAVPAQRPAGESGGFVREDEGWRTWRRRDVRDPVLRELKLIRAARDGQLEEAMKFNQRLEEELRWAYREVQKLQRVEASLRKENTHIRRRAEEARRALSSGMQRVGLMQELAQSVPQLQARISQLENQLLRYRTQCTCRFPPEESCSPAGE